MGWRETKDALRREVERGTRAGAWAGTRARHPELADVRSGAELTALLCDDDRSTWAMRRRVVLALAREHRSRPSTPLSSALVLAYWPLVSSLRGRVHSVPDCEQMVLTAFLRALSECDPAQGIEYLGWRTRRYFFRAVQADRTPRFVELPDVDDPSASTEDDALLRHALGRIRQRPGFAAIACAACEPDAGRMTAALYKRRERALARLRLELLPLSA
jgi:hypothetical protein